MYIKWYYCKNDYVYAIPFLLECKNYWSKIIVEETLFTVVIKKQGKMRNQLALMSII